MLKEAGFRRKLLTAAVMAPVAYGAYRTIDAQKQWNEDARTPISHAMPTSLKAVQDKTQVVRSLVEFSRWADDNIKNPLMRRTQKIRASIAFNKGAETGLFKSDYPTGTTALLITPDIKNEKHIAALVGREAHYLKRNIHTTDDLMGKFPFRTKARKAGSLRAMMSPEKNPIYKDIETGYEEANIAAEDPSREKTLALLRHAIKTRRDLALAMAALKPLASVNNIWEQFKN